jgi:hypothetical protein
MSCSQRLENFRALYGDSEKSDRTCHVIADALWLWNSACETSVSDMHTKVQNETRDTGRCDQATFQPLIGTTAPGV